MPTNFGSSAFACPMPENPYFDRVTNLEGIVHLNIRFVGSPCRRAGVAVLFCLGNQTRLEQFGHHCEF